MFVFGPCLVVQYVKDFSSSFSIISLGKGGLAALH